MKIYCNKQDDDPVLVRVTPNYLEEYAGSRSWLHVGYDVDDDDDQSRLGYWIRVLDVDKDLCHCLCISDNYIERTDATKAIEKATETKVAIKKLWRWSDVEPFSTKDLYDFYSSLPD